LSLSSKILDNSAGNGVNIQRSGQKEPVETEKTLSARYAEVIRLRKAIAKSQTPPKSNGEDTKPASK